MSTVGHVDGDGNVTPSVCQIQQRRDLFDDDDDDDDELIVATANASNNESHVASTSPCSADHCCRNALTMILLTTVNLVNYMDRFSVAGKISVSHFCLGSSYGF